MNNYLFNLFIAAILFIFSPLQSLGVTQQKYSDSIVINRKITKNEDISLYLKSIANATISGSVEILSPIGYVRIIIEDTEGQEYLLAEFSKMLLNDESLAFNEYGEENVFIPAISLSAIHIYMNDANLTLDTLYVSNDSNTFTKKRLSKENYSQQRMTVLQDKVNKINEYNIKNGKLWRAGITRLAMMDYERRKTALGMSNDTYTYGYEYYVGGIFDIGDYNLESKSIPSSFYSSDYPDDFDWRDRHGKNWITPLKNQGDSGYCVAFAGAAMAEAMMNLYYNQLINVDLSEQDIVEYATSNLANTYQYGMTASSAVKYIKNQGIVDENTIPFVDSPNVTFPPTRPTGLECVRIHDYSSKSIYNITKIDQIKDIIINKGPSMSGFSNGIWAHEMLLIGWHRIQAGDTLTYIDQNVGEGFYIIPQNSPYIGQHYWIFKDNYGLDNGKGHDGYLYALFVDYHCMNTIYSATTPIYSINYNEGDILCEDSDGDGYYFWGLGPKPTSCPSWIPDEPDGDDSDYTKGPLDIHAFPIDIDPSHNDTIYIDEDKEWNNITFLRQHLCIRNSAKLTIKNTLFCNKTVSITLLPYTTITIDGATINNMNLINNPNSNIEMINGGIIHYNKDGFSIPIGTKLNIKNGIIQPKL